MAEGQVRRSSNSADGQGTHTEGREGGLTSDGETVSNADGVVVAQSGRR